MAERLIMERLLAALEGNRRLTLRTIQAFPEHELFHYTPTAPLRPFAEMVKEIIQIEEGYVRGIATGRWEASQLDLKGIATREQLLEACAAVRRHTRELWPQITVERMLTVEQDPFFGGPQPHLERILYCLENEIHHRGQGYVYLRHLGIEPPAFYER